MRWKSIWVGAALSGSIGWAQTSVETWGDCGYGQCNAPPGLTNAISVVAGDTFSVALLDTGRVLAWGWDYAGRTNVPSGLTNVKAVAAGRYHTLALKTDGTIVAWGSNAYGETTVPGDLNDVVKVSGGEFASLALRSDGSVRAWGINIYGEATPPAGLSNVVDLAAGNGYACAVRANGTVTVWGGGSNPAAAWSGITNAVSVRAGYTSAALLLSDGTVVTWPSAVSPGASNIVAIAVGEQHTLALRQDGTVMAWGADFTGQCDVPSTCTNALAIAGGDFHSVALLGAGLVNIVRQPCSAVVFAGQSLLLSVGAISPAPLRFQWQLNGTDLPGATSSSLRIPDPETQDAGNYTVAISNGLGAATSAVAAVTVLEQRPFVYGQPADVSAFLGSTAQMVVSAGGSPSLSYTWYHNGALLAFATNSTLVLTGIEADAGGSYSVVVSNRFGTATSSNASLTIVPVACWGDNSRGQCSVPGGLSDVVAVAGGYLHSLALTREGQVVAWGYNYYGQGTVPAMVSNVIGIAAGAYHNLALKSNLTVTAWGNNSSGQCNVPGGLSSVVAVAAGLSHSLALKADGTVAGWGATNVGQATPPSGLSNVVAIAAGDYFSLALQRGGQVSIWGKFLAEQATYFSAFLPPGLSNIIAIAAGPGTAVALTGEGQITQWGVVQGSAQTNVLRLPGHAVEVGTGARHGAALTENGIVMCWGAANLNQTNVPAGLSNVVAISCGQNHTVALLGPAAAQFAPGTHPALANSRFNLDVSTAAGTLYLLEYKDVLDAPHWVGGDLIRGDGETRMLTNDTRAAAQRFYRIRRY